jgi:hypothetical protein
VARSAETSQQVRFLVDALTSLTIKLFEAIEQGVEPAILQVLAKRQEIIAELTSLDAARSVLAPGGSLTPGNDEIRIDFEKLLQAGDRLVGRAEERLVQLKERQRQNDVARSTARGYRPAPDQPLSTRSYDG